MSDKQAIKAQSMSHGDGMKQRVKDDVPLLANISDKVTLRSTGGEGCTSDPHPGQYSCAGCGMFMKEPCEHWKLSPELEQLVSEAYVDAEDSGNITWAVREALRQATSKVAGPSGDTSQPPVAAETPEQIAERWANKYNPCSSHGVTYYIQMALLDQALQQENHCCDGKLQKQADEAFMQSLGLVREQTGHNEWTWRNQRAQSTEAKYDAAVGQVAVLAEIVKAHTCSSPSCEDSSHLRIKQALDNAAPLVAAYKAEIEAGALEDEATRIEALHPGIAYGLRARAQEKRKAGTQAH